MLAVKKPGSPPPDENVVCGFRFDGDITAGGLVLRLHQHARGLIQMEFRFIHGFTQYGARVPAGIAHEEFAARLADMPVPLRETAETRNGIRQYMVRIGKFPSHSNSFPVNSFQPSHSLRHTSRIRSMRKHITFASSPTEPV